ncbi:MAG: hypothetical protein Q4F88_05365 [Eubacteriales bacterium]|nr:hypothetical protein [Eubacteriales bacterium]
MEEMERKYSINFDLDTSKLKIFYWADTGKAYNKAYEDIRNYLTDNGFIWQQGSGYITKNKIPDTKLNNILDIMSNNFKWLAFCIKDVKTTIIYKKSEKLKTKLLIDNLNEKNEKELLNKYSERMKEKKNIQKPNRKGKKNQKTR